MKSNIRKFIKTFLYNFSNFLFFPLFFSIFDFIWFSLMNTKWERTTLLGSTGIKGDELWGYAAWHGCHLLLWLFIFYIYIFTFASLYFSILQIRPKSLKSILGCYSRTLVNQVVSKFLEWFGLIEPSQAYDC